MQKKVGKLKKIINRYMQRLIYGSKSNSEKYVEYLKKQGVNIGEGTVFYDPISNVIDIQNPQMLYIGKNVRITHGVIILTHDYSWSVLSGVYGECIGNVAPVIIGNNVFIGMNSIIKNGVTINDNVIIGAGSVVTKNCERNSVYAGNPAKKLMSLEEYYNKRKNECIMEIENIKNICKEINSKDEAKLLREYTLFFEEYTNPIAKQLMKETGYYEKCLNYYMTIKEE